MKLKPERRMALTLLVFTFLAQLQVTSQCQGSVGRCEWEPWGQWSSCTRTCAGFRTRRRDICCGIHVPDCLDKCHRPNTSVETEPCETHCPNGGSYIDGICHCPPLRYGICCERNETDNSNNTCARHCTWSNWMSWGACIHDNTTCGCGSRTRERQLCCKGNLNKTMCSEDCEMYDTAEERNCTSASPQSTTTCDQCSWNPWQSWTSCSRNCGGGHRSRSRSPSCCHGTTVWDCLFDCGLKNSDAREEDTCGEVCHNQGMFSNGSCLCTQGFDGQCCDAELTESNCTKCSLLAWGPWGTCSQLCDGGQRSRTRRPCCRKGQDIDACRRQCVLDKDMLSQIEGCNEVCCDSHVYLSVLTGAGSAVGAIIITSLFWCICQHRRRGKSGEHVYDRPSYSVTQEGNPSSDYANATFDENTATSEEQPYDKLH